MALLKLFLRKWVPRIHLGSQHVFDFGLLRVEREAMREAGFRIIVLERELVEFVAAIGCISACTRSRKGIHFLLRSLG
jgi:hypothetical protein